MNTTITYRMAADQSYDTEELRLALVAAGIAQPDIRGMGPAEFHVVCGSEQAGLADDAVQLHLTTDWDLWRTREAQKVAVREHFDAASAAPVVALGAEWNGGFESALKLDGAKRMAEIAGLTRVSVYDLVNQEHVLTLADATVVALNVASAYQTAFAKKQQLFNEIDAADAATVEGIKW